MAGARIRHFRVEGEKVVVFPSVPEMTTYWHAIILEPADSYVPARSVTSAGARRHRA